MSNDIVLEIKNIRKKIGTHVIIDDVSFELKKGDILGFIGQNGAGKTTIIKLILGLQKLNSGNIKICGYDLKKDFVKAIENVGAIVENPDLYMYMSGYENLELSAKLYEVSKERINEVVRLVGLEEKIHEKVKKYSLGMRQRLGLAQALLHEPQVLILDEPMNGLDPEGIKDLKDLLVTLANKNIGILISSHLLSELESICTRVCILDKGNIILDDTIENIKKLTAVEEYTLEVSNNNLDKILLEYQVIDNNHIKVKTTKEKLTNILKALLLNNIYIYEIKKETLTLEKIFLTATKKDSHD